MGAPYCASEPSRRLAKTQIALPPLQSSLFYSSGMGLDNSPGDADAAGPGTYFENHWFALILWSRCHRHTSFYCASLYCTLQILHFLQTEGLWQPCVVQVSWHHFPNSMFSPRISVSHLIKVCNCFLRYNAIAHLIDCVMELFICAGKPQNPCDLLYCYIPIIVVAWN